MSDIPDVLNNDQRLILFLDQVNELSSYISENTNFLPELEGFLFSAALTMNASVGIVLIKHNKFKAYYHFGIDSAVAERIIEDFDKRNRFKETHLAGAIDEIVDVCANKLNDGIHDFGFLIFINKENRDGIGFFDNFDRSIMTILSNQLTMASSKLASNLEQTDLINLNEKILNAGSNAVLAVNKDARLIFANKKAEKLLDFEFVKHKSLFDLIPIHSPSGMFIKEAIALKKELYAESIMLSASNPKILSIQISPFIKEKMNNAVGQAFVITIQDISEINHLKETFSKYVNDDVLAITLNSGKKMRLGGARKSCAIFFCDIRGFTSFSEVREPEEVVEVLNQYFNSVISAINENLGIIDKLIGDEIMAVFDHKGGKDHPALRAVMSALEMRERLEVFNSLRDEQNEQKLYFGIGIHYGEVIAGNIGSFDRMDYTIIGDNVNTTARFCSFARPEEIIISDVVYGLIKDHCRCEALKPIEVKGKTKPISVYRVLDKF